MINNKLKISDKGKSTLYIDKKERVEISIKQESIKIEEIVSFFFFKNNDENKLITITSNVHRKISQIALNISYISSRNSKNFPSISFLLYLLISNDKSFVVHILSCTIPFTYRKLINKDRLA